MTLEKAMAWSLRPLLITNGEEQLRALDEAREAGAALAAEVRRLQAALRESHAAAVEAAFREGHAEGANDYSEALHGAGVINADRCWLASEAKARLT